MTNEELLLLDKLARQHALAEYVADDFVAVATALDTIKVTTPVPTFHNFSSITEKFDEADALTLKRSLRDAKDNYTEQQTGEDIVEAKADYEELLIGLRSQGGQRLDFDWAQVRLHRLAAYSSWDNEYRTKIKRLGKEVDKVWEYHNYSSAPTNIDVHDAKDYKAAQDAAATEEQAVQLLLNHTTSAYNAAQTAVVNAGSSITNAQIVTAFSNQLDALRP
jgi:hypothetical protein